MEGTFFHTRSHFFSRIIVSLQLNVLLIDYFIACQVIIEVILVRPSFVDFAIK